jgi:hypothetical protein
MIRPIHSVGFAALTACAAWLLFSPRGEVGIAAESDARTVLLTFGAGASALESWDGSAEVSGGELVALEGRHFSESDSIAAPNAWRASNRREAIDGFPRVNYNEMSPEELPPALFSPVGVYLTIRAAGPARVAVKTKQGNFEFSLAAIGQDPTAFLDGRATVVSAPAVEKLSTPEYEDDEAAVARLPGGKLAVAWVAYRDRGDRVFVRIRSGGSWSQVEEATTAAGDLFRCSLAVDDGGSLWAFWSEREGTRWHIRGRQRKDGAWQQVMTVSGEGTNTFHRAASSAGGTIFVTWQSFRGPAGGAQSDIVARRYANGAWSDEMRISSSAANDWEPAVAGGPGGSAYFAWDSYEKGNYDIRFRAYENSALGDVQEVTSSPRFQAHAAVAVDPQGRPWLAWDESGVNWGKDQGYLITPPMSVPLHQERSLRLAMWDGRQWLEPKAKVEPFYVYRLYPNFENPQIAFDGRGMLAMVFRHWTRRNAYGIGSPQTWESFLTRFDGRRWSEPVALAHCLGSIEKRPALVRADDGEIWAAWMTDNRPFATMVPENAEIYAASLGSAAAAPDYGSPQFTAFTEPFAEALPIHASETKQIQAIRGYTVTAGSRQYKIYRGDMHRHTDISQDFKYDGSLIEVYRYALDAAGFDYIVPTDHQLGYDHEFTWWQHEKLIDLFHVPDTFTPLFGYERSVPFPNGHRNIIFAKRGIRTLPVPEAERRGQERAGRLFEYLRANDGISMPHSSGTDQGTDWFDNDPELEPLMEIYQGYRASYEYMGAPLAASPQKLREQRSGFKSVGYWWDALRKGYKLGVQASSDHWSTHISYACILAEQFTRESMFEALKKRHTYGATDNIILDFQAEANGQNYIMGDTIRSQTAPRLKIRVIGTGPIKQLVIVKNQQFVYVRHPNAEEIGIEFVDRDFQPGSNYYYTRVVQTDGQVAWSSPIWVE